MTSGFRAKRPKGLHFVPGQSDSFGETKTPPVGRKIALLDQLISVSKPL